MAQKIAKKKVPDIRKIAENLKKGVKFGYYYRMYENAAIDNKCILIESKNGEDLAGNMFAIVKELTKPEYAGFRIYLVINETKKEFFHSVLEKNHVSNVKLVFKNSRRYFRLLATAGYLFLDTSFAREYIKKEGQVITNTWHGTPLKLMGRHVTDRAYAMGNVQRNLQMADFLVYPNRRMKDIMFDAYCLDNIYNGTILWSGYPRNAIFFDAEAGRSLKKELGLDGKRTYVYMPTWRGTLTDLKTEVQVDELEYLLGLLDQQMGEDMVILTKLHPFVDGGLDYSRFSHIQCFPAGYDSYEVLNASDGLITDYSSVFFDFVNTGKKVILWAYDLEAYLGERGVYTDLKNMPFPVVKGVEELAEEMRRNKGYDETAFTQDYGYCDNVRAAEYVCKRVLFQEVLCAEEKQEHNGKDNVFFYVSTLAKNGITTSITSLLEYLDLNEKNFFAVFREKTFAPFPNRIELLPEEFRLWPISAEPETKMSLKEMFFNYLYYNRNIGSGWVKKKINHMYDLENKRHFPDLKIDYAIHFTGYEKHIIHMFELLEAERSIFVHNDMLEELRTKNNQHRLTLEEAYSTYNHVAIVSEDLRESTETIAGRKDHIAVVHNCHAYETVQKKGSQPIEFQSYTKLNVKPELFLEALDEECTRFINIGRFSGEKGHAMLIEAFDEYWQTHMEAQLIIIGGYGNLYGQTVKLARKAKARKHIFIVKQIDNPMPILKKCSMFILSSFYEGFGLVLLEADTLGIPVVSTDVVGPRGFMKENGGYMVKPTKEGLLEAMYAYEQKKVNPLAIDYEAYNREAAGQFEMVIGKGLKK